MGINSFSNSEKPKREDFNKVFVFVCRVTTDSKKQPIMKNVTLNWRKRVL